MQLQSQILESRWFMWQHVWKCQEKRKPNYEGMNEDLVNRGPFVFLLIICFQVDKNCSASVYYEFIELSRLLERTVCSPRSLPIGWGEKLCCGWPQEMSHLSLRNLNSETPHPTGICLAPSKGFLPLPGLLLISPAPHHVFCVIVWF